MITFMGLFWLLFALGIAMLFAGTVSVLRHKGDAPRAFVALALLWFIAAWLTLGASNKASDRRFRRSIFPQKPENTYSATETSLSVMETDTTMVDIDTAVTEPPSQE
jgi:hypothetical protein